MPTRFSKALMVLFAVSTLAFSSTAHAAGRPGSHHDGFLLRLSLGGGGARTKVDNGSSSVEYSGGGVNLNVAIGGMITDNFALHLTLGGWGLSGPDVTVKAGSVSLSGTTNSDTSLTLALLGPGITTYFGSNFYFSGSLGMAALNATRGNKTYKTDTGVALDLTLGKEWWASDSWGMGLAAAFGFHSVPSSDGDNNFNGESFGLRFSATYN